ncbi:MAG: hypothetical protein LBL46_00980 [Rickettsiales bacterium]|nr:hypothetical protein [Rickettsiales bacterium]
MRPSVAEVGGRAVIQRTGAMTGSNVDEESRKLTRRARAAVANPFATPTATDEAAPSSAKDLSACSADYFDCLNQFCNVLDANQKQCSCSSRLTQYKKVEDSLAEANDELNNVANQIRYVGLSADEIRAIMKETEAEAVMSTTKDTTQSRNMLDEIEKLIKTPGTDAATSGGSSFGDFELDFSGDDFSLASMFGSTEESFANMRGTELYEAAKKKCKPLLTKCAASKTDQALVSGQYDIEIDKACVAYEAGLKKATAGVKTNVRSATQMLQKARLAVLQDQNSFDAKGCVSALDTCMKDPMVCGADYNKCIDPTKTAVDESGGIIPGGDVVMLQNLISKYSATCLDTLMTSTANCGLDADNNANTADVNGKKVVDYLLTKIGANDGTGRAISGFCRPTLDKCRKFTYESGQYVKDNAIVKSYLERTMTQVRAAQNKIITTHASECVMQVSACYNSQITQVNSYSGGQSLSPSTVKPILMGACRNVALSCAYAVFPNDDSSSGDTNTCWLSPTQRNPNGCINKLSEMFYQSMLCPINSKWTETAAANAAWVETDRPPMLAPNNAKSNGYYYVNSNCQCNADYFVYSGQCSAAAQCPTNSVWDASSSSATTGSTTTPAFVSPYCRCIKPGTISGGACP